MSKIAGAISYFIAVTNEVKDPNNVQDPKLVATVKKAMEDAESLLSTFKEGQVSNFNSLLTDERILDHEVGGLSKKIDMWLRGGYDDGKSVKLPSKLPASDDKDITKDLPPEVAQFQRFLDEFGGHAGGWEEEDHEAFLKHWAEGQADHVLVESIAGFVPTKNDEEILEHIQWYRRYLTLKLTKKEAIARWKEYKQSQQQDKIAIGKERLQEMAELEAQRKAELEEMENAERMARKQQLNAWKVEKELQRMKEEEKRSREEMERRIKQEKDKLRHIEMKEKIREVQELKDRQRQIEKVMQEEEKRLECEVRKAQIEANKPRIELRVSRIDLFFHFM